MVHCPCESDHGKAHFIFYVCLQFPIRMEQIPNHNLIHMWFIPESEEVLI